MKDLKDWIKENNLQCAIADQVLTIEDFGKLLFVKGVDEKILDKDFSMILSEEENEILESDADIKFLVFKFGNRFYYCDSNNRKKNEYNEEVIIPQFNNFINIGKFNSEFEDIGFCNLGVHSGYELLNGSGDISSWIKKAKYLKQKSLGVCEKNTLASSLSFQLDCEKNNIKAISGMTVSVAYNYEKEKEFQEIYELKLFIKDKSGWQNILRISKSINVDYDGFIPLEELLPRLGGLIVVIFKESFLYLNMKNPENFKSELKALRKNIEREDLYFQIDFIRFEDPNLDLENLKNIKLYMDEYSSNIKPVYIEDCYYVEKIDYSVKSILNKIDRRTAATSQEQYLKSVDEIIAKNSDMLVSEESLSIFFEALENTKEISDKCNFKIDVGASKIPEYEIDNKIEFFENLLLDGFRNKILPLCEDDDDKLDIYFSRLEREKKVILDADLVDYFLVLWDIIKWSHENDVLVGPGRGSAAGSLICYVLNITEVDPIKYNLLFERFLNEVRIMPDVFFDAKMENGKVIRIKKGSTVFTVDGAELVIEEEEQLHGLDIDIKNYESS